MEAKLKVLLCGPQGQGKTRVANLLGGIATQGVYDPTAGVRIIELERPLTVREPKSRREIQIVASIELWDMSGDLQYENAWPACQKDVHGIIVVAEALQMQLEQSAPEKQVDFWFQAFSARVGLEATQAFVMVLANDEVTNTAAVLSAGKSKLGAYIRICRCTRQ